MTDGHVRVLPLHVANKIAAGEVVERPASVVKELLENALDAGARSIRVAVTQGGRKLVAVQDDGCGMTRDDAVLALERQATSKIRDVDDIERIDTLGFRGEAIPSIASVSRFALTTRRRESDEGTFLQVNAGTLAEIRAAGAPPGTLVEVRDLFCNVPARRKFLRACPTEESHIRQIFTVHALAHPEVAFALTLDGREQFRLAPAASTADRVLDLFGPDFLSAMLPLPDAAASEGPVAVTGFIERPNLAMPTRREQYVFINGRPATAPSLAYALREAYPHRPGDVRPAAILFLTLPPTQVDVNVHPTKREVRFRDNGAVRQAVMAALERALMTRPVLGSAPPTVPSVPAVASAPAVASTPSAPVPPVAPAATAAPAIQTAPSVPLPQPVPVEVDLPIAADGGHARPWAWFKYLAQSASGYLLVETDAGIVTVNPLAARERIAYEKLLDAPCAAGGQSPAQQLLIPETVRLSPVEFARLGAALEVVRGMGFQIEAFGDNTFKIDAVPQILGALPPGPLLATIAHDLSEAGSRRAGARWREELIAKSIARSFAGTPARLTEEGATRLVEELCQTRMPYVCPRGKPVMIFTSTRELNRKFARE